MLLEGSGSGSCKAPRISEKPDPLGNEDMKVAKIDKKYCRKLLDKHYSEVPAYDPEESASCEMTPEVLMHILSKACQGNRFKVSFDSSSVDDSDSWDVLGPGLKFGQMWFLERGSAEQARDALNSILHDHFGNLRSDPCLSTDAHRNRVILEGPCCPACGSLDINRNEVEFKNSVYVVRKDCEGCNAEWKEIFALQSYQDLQAG